MVRKELATIIDAVAQIPVLAEQIKSMKAEMNRRFDEQGKETDRRLQETEKAIEGERMERRDADKEAQGRIHILETRP